MSYIGNTPTQQNFVAGADQFNGTGSQTVFTLSRNVNTVFDIFVAISNVPQDPYSAYSVSGNTLTFTSAPPSGTGNIYVVYRATNVQTFVPSPGATVGGPFGIQGNLNFYGTGNRITGDFTNATLANRVAFQSSTTNGETSLVVIPNGTSTATRIQLGDASNLSGSGNFLNLFNTGSEVSIRAGTYSGGTGLPMTFYTGGSERMRVDTSGNVGIGTSSPGYRLEVKGPSATAGQLSIHDGTGDTTVSGNNAASLLFQARDTSVRTIAEIDAVNTTTNGTGGAMVFQTRISDTLAERARIDSSGNFNVGRTVATTSNTVGCSVMPVGSIIIERDNDQLMSLNRLNGNGVGILFSRGAGNSVGNITLNTSSTAYNTSSDYRLKENVQPMTGALAKVAALKPCTYTWKADGSAGEGFIAHELQAVVPDAVTGEKDAVNEDGSIKPQGIDTSFLVATLTAAIKEQQQMIETLQAEVAALKGAA